jgi:hypothetical protein
MAVAAADIKVIGCTFKRMLQQLALIDAVRHALDEPDLTADPTKKKSGPSEPSASFTRAPCWHGHSLVSNLAR